MDKQFDNSEALAHGYMMIALYFGAGIFIWICWTTIFNQFLTIVINPWISDGMVSVQTVNATAWSVNVLRYAPPIMLVFGFIYGINRAIYKRGGPS